MLAWMITIGETINDIQQLNISNDEQLVVRFPNFINIEEFEMLIKPLKTIMYERGYTKPILFMPNDCKLETLSEEEMEKAGWVRKL
jgi:N12 class adenine-specific DNA methylase